MKLKKIIVVLLACMLGMAMGEQPFFQMKAKENGNISFAEQELQKTSQTNPINKEASKGYQLARPASKGKAAYIIDQPLFYCGRSRASSGTRTCL